MNVTAFPKQVGELKKKKEDASALIEKMGNVSAKIKEYDESLRVTEEELNAFVMIVPNIQHESVPQGHGSEDNPVVRTWGEKPVFSFEPKQHFELGESLNILDFARGQKLPERVLRFIAERALSHWSGHWSISCSTCMWKSTVTRKC
jgi:seryl-tRNA synthetase